MDKKWTTVIDDDSKKRISIRELSEYRYMIYMLFKRNYKDYTLETIGYIRMFFVLLVATSFVANRFIIANNLLKLIVNRAVCVVVPNVLIILFYFRTDNFKYCIDLVKKIINIVVITILKIIQLLVWPLMKKNIMKLKRFLKRK